MNSINRHGNSRSGKRRVLTQATQLSISNVSMTKVNDPNFRPTVAQREANGQSSDPAPS